MSNLFVLGGARSGKSRYAQGRAEQIGQARIFVATAEAYDDEMRDRIARHRADRGEGWNTVEAPTDLARAISDHSRPDNVLLVDCLTLWTSNLLLAERDIPLIVTLHNAPGPVILVANEVGLGIVPDNALARRFRDAAGIVNQRVAAVATEVVFIAAGLPLRLK
jgi:adenosylcobinamide kinase/adenosylcobinamide-phosphate guanylyltransferase